MFAEYLKQLRTEKGLTQRGLCTVLNLADKDFASIDSVTVSRWERGSTEPHITKAIKVLRVLTQDLRPFLAMIPTREQDDVISKLSYEKFESAVAGIRSASYVHTEASHNDLIVEKTVDLQQDKNALQNIKNFIQTSKSGYPGLISLDFENLYRSKKLILKLYINPSRNEFVGHNLAMLFNAQELANELTTPHKTLPFYKAKVYSNKEPLAICSLSRFAANQKAFDLIHSDFVNYVASHSNIHSYYHYLHNEVLLDYMVEIGAEKVGFDTPDKHGKIKIGKETFRNCLLRINTETILSRPEIIRLLKKGT